MSELHNPLPGTNPEMAALPPQPETIRRTRTAEIVDAASQGVTRLGGLSPVSGLVVTVILGGSFVCLACLALGFFLYTVIKSNETNQQNTFAILIRQQAEDTEKFRRTVEGEGEKNRTVFVAQSKVNQDLTIKSVESAVTAVGKSMTETAKLEQRVNDLTLAVNDLRSALKTMTEALDALRKKLAPPDCPLQRELPGDNCIPNNYIPINPRRPSLPIPDTAPAYAGNVNPPGDTLRVLDLNHNGGCASLKGGIPQDFPVFDSVAFVVV